MEFRFADAVFSNHLFCLSSDVILFIVILLEIKKVEIFCTGLRRL